MIKVMAICHGNPVIKTPYLDGLREESVRFTDFHVAPIGSEHGKRN
jgi:arylsulfatase A-like enzyme